jgi:hypothetical protein
LVVVVIVDVDGDGGCSAVAREALRGSLSILFNVGKGCGIGCATFRNLSMSKISIKHQ